MSDFRPTPEQHAIIEHPLEPLRVSAGAGTGKTTTVALRIAHLVEHLALDPERVLGITFTNKAAEELADRVRSMLGVDDSIRQVDVHTYHGFAAGLLSEFGVLVGVERGAAIVTPTFTRQMISEVIRSIELPHLNVTWSGVVDWVRRLASAMGDHLVAPTTLLTHDGPDDGNDVLRQRADLIRAIEAYESEKRRLGVVDYADLVSAAHRLVSEHRWVAERVRSRFDLVILDEYQDTNPAQRALLAAIFDSGFPVTAVGDPDQTIYEWRGASIANFRRFPEHFPRSDGGPARTLPLTENRRSGALILDLANQVRDAIDGDPRSPLRPVSGAEPSSVRTAWFDDAVAEAEWIADDIRRLHADGHAWSDIAVLFRKNKDMALIRDALTTRDVPIEVANLGGLLSVPEVVELHAWLRLLDDPSDGPALARLLMGSRHRLGMADLAVLSRWVADRRRLAPDEEHLQVSLLEAIDHLDGLDNLRPSAYKALTEFSRRHRSLLQAAQGVSLVELCRRILDAVGAWRDIEAMSDAGRLSARLNLYRFLDLAESWSPLEGRPSLASFLDYLRTMDDEPSEELDTARLAGADAVTLLTVHRSKGLEWPIVFIPATYQNNFPSGVTGAYDNPLARPESLPYELRMDRDDLPALTPEMDDRQQKSVLRERHDSQEWRIAYVAVTRAKQLLTVTGAHWVGSPEPRQKPVKPSPLFDLVRDHPGTRVEFESAAAPVRPDTLGFRADRISSPDPVFGQEGWQDALARAIEHPGSMRAEAANRGIVQAYDAAVDDYQQMLFLLPEPADPVAPAVSSTSVSGLVTYAGCPKRFEWAEVDRLPRRHSTAARRGVDVHRRIELHHRGVLPLEEADPDLYDVPEHGETQESWTAPYDVYVASRFAESRPALVEAPFELDVGDLIVRGRVDAIYREGDDWEVVDFKSGRPSDDPAVRVQLEAYALAVQRGAFGASPPTRLQVTFAYLGGGLVERSELADTRWLETAGEHLEEIALGIVSERYDPTPSPTCRRCDFLTFCPAGKAFLES